MERSGIEITIFEEIGNLYEVLKVSTYNAYDINDVSNTSFCYIFHIPR